MNMDDWAKLAKDVERYYDQFEGFVILHGTDTMCYTASALSFMLENLNKPVVLTGAQVCIHTHEVHVHVHTIYSCTLVEIVSNLQVIYYCKMIARHICVLFDITRKGLPLPPIPTHSSLVSVHVYTCTICSKRTCMYMYM